MSEALRVLVTRPARQAADWVARLREAGIDAAALPLIEIVCAPDEAPVRAAWERLPAVRLAVFVSPNAAECFFGARPSAVRWPAGTRAAAVGPGTSRVLRELGVDAGLIVEPAQDAAQFDSEALWARLCGLDWNGQEVLIVRGDGGREWLAETLRAHGAQVSAVCAYRRRAPHLDDAQQAILAAARREPRRHLWFFSSSEAITNLGAIAAASADWSGARALATHPRIAESAQRLGFGEVVQVRPAFDAVSACIQSIAP
ncbi:MAG TPA: uroporphyrinogen-III synthase [Burkholderiaceae bacterium]|nr:uroporphyrinogen-III synthase [Burkholderiaceae bacterium]